MTADGESGRVYGGRPIVDRRADRRRQFLNAGLDVMGTKGYTATSVADVCAAAGLARSQFYSEFANREALLTAVYDLVQDEALAAVVAALENVVDRDRRSLVAAAMTALIESLGHDPRRARICYLEMLGVSDSVELHRRRRRATWANYIETTIRAELGDDFVPPGGHQLAASAFLGALTELVSEWSRSAPPRDPVEGIVEAMIAVLGAFVPYLDD